MKCLLLILAIVAACLVPCIQYADTPTHGYVTDGYILISPHVGGYYFFLTEDEALEYAEPLSANNATVPIYVVQVKQVRGFFVNDK